MAVQQGRSEVHGAKNNERQAFACVGEPAVSWRRIVMIFTRPARACRDGLFSRVGERPVSLADFLVS
jgi:hypothetical protein